MFTVHTIYTNMFRSHLIFYFLLLLLLYVTTLLPCRQTCYRQLHIQCLDLLPACLHLNGHMDHVSHICIRMDPLHILSFVCLIKPANIGCFFTFRNYNYKKLWIIHAFYSITDEVTFERKSKRSRSEARGEKPEERIKNVETQTSDDSGAGLCYYVS